MPTSASTFVLDSKAFIRHYKLTSPKAPERKSPMRIRCACQLRHGRLLEGGLGGLARPSLGGSSPRAGGCSGPQGAAAWARPAGPNYRCLVARCTCAFSSPQPRAFFGVHMEGMLCTTTGGRWKMKTAGMMRTIMRIMIMNIPLNRTSEIQGGREARPLGLQLCHVARNPKNPLVAPSRYSV